MVTDQKSAQPRVMRVSGETITALAWIGPMLMLLAEAIGSGEILTEPVAGARYGGALLWLILLTIVTKAFWNEAIGRVCIVTGQNFLEACSGMGAPVSWVPWIWFCVNLIKDFLLRGGIVAIAGLICHDIFGGLLPGAGEVQQQIFWTFLNFLLVWVILIVGGYRPVETFNTVMCLLFTLSLLICASFVVPGRDRGAGPGPGAANGHRLRSAADHDVPGRHRHGRFGHHQVQRLGRGAGDGPSGPRPGPGPIDAGAVSAQLAGGGEPDAGLAADQTGPTSS